MGESTRHVGSRWVQTVAAAIVGVLVVGGTTGPARATIKYGAMQISGNLETQNLIRDPELDKFQFVQNRNTFRLRFDWDWLQKGKLIDKFDLPFIESSKLYVLYRGVYDGFYALAPTDNQIGQTRFDDLVGGPIAGNRIGQLGANGKLLPGAYSRLSNSQRSSLAYENSLREAYVDLKLKDAPLSFRLGRQQVIWGESDQFRIMDIWNPLDTTWHFQQESWDNIRIPLWLGKALWDIGDVGPFSNTFMEVVYNPFDFQAGAKLDFLPEPWAVPVPNPLRTGQVTNNNPDRPGSGTFITPMFDTQGTSIHQGDFKRNPRDASEIGTRIHAVTPQGIEFSLNYLYGRGRGVGAASPTGFKIEKIGFFDPANGGTFPRKPIGTYQYDLSNPNAVRSVIPIDVVGEWIHPYMHIFGLTGNYFEGDFTSAVLRFETAYAMGEPFQTTDPATRVPVQNGTADASGQFGYSPLGFTKRDVWTGMVGFDRPTWIRWLNSKSTWFITGQVFWNYTTGGHVDELRGTAGAGDDPYFGNIGVWRTGPYAGQIERQQRGNTTNNANGQPVDPLAIGNGDNRRQWEHLITLAATTFYRGGTVVPFVADAWDPVNDNNEILWNVDYFFTNDLILSLQQKFFMTYGSKAPSNDPWFAGGRFAARDETGIKITYQF